MRAIRVLLPIAYVLLPVSLLAQESPKASNEPRHYTFSAEAGKQRVIEGSFKAYGDSIVLNPKSARCALAPFGDDAATVARFKCEGVNNYEDFTLVFIRANPEQASWSGVYQKMQGIREQTCRQAVNPSSGVASAPQCTITREERPTATGPRTAMNGQLKVTLRK